MRHHAGRSLAHFLVDHKVNLRTMRIPLVRNMPPTPDLGVHAGECRDDGLITPLARIQAQDSLQNRIP